MDYRLGPRRYAPASRETGGLSVKIAEDLRNCVVFIGWPKAGPEDEAPIDPIGTGFLVTRVPGMPLAVFLVTARHVADAIHPPFLVRINQKGGRVGVIKIEQPSDARWCFHKDENVDLAVMPLATPSSLEGTALGADGWFDPERDPKIWATLEAGDSIAVIGLFHLHKGTKRNLPVVHTGSIALLPGDERVPVDGKSVEAFLVQANAISGCSGSPVLVAPWGGYTVGGKNRFMAMAGHAVLLGVWSSSWKVESSQIVAIRTDDDDARGQAAPLGMGIVVPTAKLVDILGGDELKRAHQELMKRLLRDRSATPDSLSPTTDEEPQHKEAFKSLLNAAAKKQKPDD